MEEKWKDIPGYEGLYQASNTGLIRSAPGKTTSNKRFAVRVWKTRILRPKRRGCRGDEAVTLWKDGLRADILVARLVAMAWVDGYSPELTVNHIDGNPRNNICTNLEWVTLSENIKKGFADGLYKSIQAPIVLVDSLFGQELQFDSMASASRHLGRNSGYVSGCLKRGYPVVGQNGMTYTVQMIKEDINHESLR